MSRQQRHKRKLWVRVCLKKSFEEKNEEGINLCNKKVKGKFRFFFFVKKEKRKNCLVI
jgi:hypothetical protein